jgi:signal transduction histidine kinase
LLSLARADAPGASRAAAWIDLANVVEQTCGRMRMLAADAGLDLRTNIRLACPFHGDAEGISRLLEALIDNAIKYTPTGGAITVSMIRTGGADEAYIEIEDTGIGLPADAIERVFDRFYRVSQDRSRQTGGAGLGLAIAQAIALQHGGGIGIKSVLGAGCLVRVTLPL